MLTLGTAGHIDHGKTVLVAALTGVNTDRLPEEQARGISIELGFASLALPSGAALSVVDVPGHERFVRTMVAGATGVDLFLLVVAADDGVMPQTREHLRVLEMLEVPAGAVGITKTDLVEPQRVERVVEEVGETLAGGRYERSPIVPVSALAGDNLAKLVETLDRLAAGCSRRATDGEPRLPVDRSFSLKGIGTVVTGTLWSGALAIGDELRIEPSKRTARVRSIEVHGDRRERVEAGQRVAVNLAGIRRNDVARGDTLVAPDSHLMPTYRVDAAVELAADARPLGRGTRVQLHHATRASAARVAPISSDVLEPGTRAYVQLRLEQPILPAAGDRFVLRQVAPPDTIGGGVVIDAAPRKHGSGSQHVERLELLERGDPLEQLAHGHLDQSRARLLAALNELGSARPASRGAIANAAGLAEADAAPLLAELVAAGNAVPRGPGFQTAEAVRRDGPNLARLVELLRQDALEPRGVEALASELGATVVDTRALLDRGVLDGRVARLKPNLYYHPEILSEAERKVIALCRRDGSVTIASLRDELDTSRKYAQALLEHFDVRRVTRRRGDEHVLRR